MSDSHEVNSFDLLCDFVLLVFITVLFVFTANTKSLFIPVEVGFIAVFTSRFLLRKSKMSLYTLWSVGLLGLAFISTTYAPDQKEAIRLSISVVQVVLFGNLLIPYFRDDVHNIHVFLHACIVGALGLVVRLWQSAPMEVLFSKRFGETIGVNANYVGFALIIGAVIALFYGVAVRKYGYLLLFLGFAVLSMFSGSRKVVVVLVLGVLLIMLLTRERTIASFLVFIISLGVLTGLVSLSFTWEPLYNVLGKRIETFLKLFSNGNTDGSTSIRLEMIFHGLKMFLQKPLFGWGLSAFATTAGYGYYSHSNYVELLVSLGSVGFLWFYLPLFGVLLGSLKSFFSQNKSPLLVLSITLLLIMFVDDIARIRYESEISHMLYALCYSIAISHLPQTGIDIPTLMSKVWQWLKHPRVSLKG